MIKPDFLATLYIEDVGDLIKETGHTPFWFSSRYAEKLGMSAHSFAPLQSAFTAAGKYHGGLVARIAPKPYRNSNRPDVVGITIPFPGNLYAGLKMRSIYQKNIFPYIKIVAGGGFVKYGTCNLSEPENL